MPTIITMMIVRIVVPNKNDKNIIIMITRMIMTIAKKGNVITLAIIVVMVEIMLIIRIMIIVGR